MSIIFSLHSFHKYSYLEAIYNRKDDLKAINSRFKSDMLESLNVTKHMYVFVFDVICLLTHSFTHHILSSLSQLFPNAAPEAHDLMYKLLQFNPDKRPTADQALAHPYLAQFHCPGKLIILL